MRDWKTWSVVLIAPFLAVAAPIPPERGLDSRDVMFRIEWAGSTSKPIFLAADATASREDELKRWRKARPNGYSFIALISPDEADAMWDAIGDFDVVVHVGQPPSLAMGNGWCITITRGRREYFVDLGASEETARVFAAIREQLADDHRRPIERVVESLQDRLRGRKHSQRGLKDR